MGISAVPVLKSSKHLTKNNMKRKGRQGGNTKKSVSLDTETHKYRDTSIIQTQLLYARSYIFVHADVHACACMHARACTHTHTHTHSLTHTLTHTHSHNIKLK